MNEIFEEIREKRKRQDEKFGEQDHPMIGVTSDLWDKKKTKFPSEYKLFGGGCKKGI